jgi:hypothetical protein
VLLFVPGGMIMQDAQRDVSLGHGVVQNLRSRLQSSLGVLGALLVTRM